MAKQSLKEQAFDALMLFGTATAAIIAFLSIKHFMKFIEGYEQLSRFHGTLFLFYIWSLGYIIYRVVKYLQSRMKSKISPEEPEKADRYNKSMQTDHPTDGR